MRWVRIRKALIPEPERALFERFSANIIGGILAGGSSPIAEEMRPVYHDPTVRIHALAWMTEQYDRAERWETWSLTMEIAITLFVGVEILLNDHVLKELRFLTAHLVSLVRMTVR